LLCLGLELRVMQNLIKELRYFWSCDIGEVHGPANSQFLNLLRPICEC
jgi:hypothetical protein